MNLVLMLRLIAAAGALTGLATVAFFSRGYPTAGLGPLALWAALPMPLGCWLISKAARRPLSTGVGLAGAATALLFGAWLYWDMTVGPAAEGQSLAGLIVLFAPLYQYAIVGFFLLAAIAANRFCPRGAAATP